MGDELRPDRLTVRCTGFRRPERTIRTKETLASRRRYLLSILHWNRDGGSLSGICSLAHPGRLCDWVGFESLSRLHRRTGPSSSAGKACLHEPTHDRVRHPAGAGRELAHREAHLPYRHGERDPELMEWPGGLALDVRCNRHSVSAVPYCDVLRSGKSALACQAWRAR